MRSDREPAAAGTSGGPAPSSAGASAAPHRPRFTVEHVLHPRFRDTDAMGHVNNAVYVTYLEVARQEYWRAFTQTHDYRRVPFILAHVTIDFRSEALVNEILVLGIRCSWIGGKSFAFEYVIEEQATRRRVVDATSIQVCYDYDTKRSMPVPDALRRALEAFEGRSLARPAASR